MKRMRIVVLSSLVAGCAAAPKPPELEAFEKLEAQTSPIERARKRSPELVADSDRLYERARKEWESKDLEESRRDALMGSIKLKTALALAEQDQAKARIQSADAAYAKSEEEYGRHAKELAGAAGADQSVAEAGRGPRCGGERAGGHRQDAGGVGRAREGRGGGPSRSATTWCSIRWRRC